MGHCEYCFQYAGCEHLPDCKRPQPNSAEKFPEIQESEYGPIDLEFANSRYLPVEMTSADITDWWNLREGFVSGFNYAQSLRRADADRIRELEAALDRQAAVNLGTAPDWYKSNLSNESRIQELLRDKLAVAVEALEFYATAFDKKVSESGMGEFTPFLVDRGNIANTYLAKIRGPQEGKE